MIVLVDIGNTRTKYRIDKNNADGKRAVIENSQISEQWLTEHWSKAEQVIIGSVTLGALTDLITDWGNKNQVKVCFIESEQQRFGVTNSYQQPKSLGVDRWLTFLGASILFPQSGVVIIDAGTATTLDVLDNNGVHQGGWIFSGIDLLLSQLNNNTSKVKFEKSDKADINFGKSTSECVNNAAWAATISMINTGIKTAENTYDIQYCILLGGNAERILPFIETKHLEVELLQDLIFDGLKRYSL